MEKKTLYTHQIQAIDAALNALRVGKKRILLNMATGTGVTTILLTLAARLISENKKVLILTKSISEKEFLLQQFHEREITFASENCVNASATIITYPWIRVNMERLLSERYQYIFLHHAELCTSKDAALTKLDAALIGFASRTSQDGNEIFSPEDCVYQYTMENAVRDGLLSPLYDPAMYVPAIEGFCQRLMEQFGCKPESKRLLPGKEIEADLCFSFKGRKIWVECKSYRDSYVSRQTINIALSKLAKAHHNLDGDGDIFVLIIFGQVSEIDKQEAYTKRNVLIWDIQNLIYYCQSNDQLLNELSRLAYFPISGADPIPSAKWPLMLLDTAQEESYDPRERAESLIHGLQNCRIGRNNFRQYEAICQEIIEFLFSDSFFNISKQHRTENDYFRMDLICSLKSESAQNHNFWRMLIHHYNSHFVVFEFKNYGTPLNQNLIYVTEKYLFNAALRNVAIIISRKGFSKNATFAALGCLKEHGKLILDVTDDDLVEMLEAKLDGREPTDHLLLKMENFLMSMSK